MPKKYGLYSPTAALQRRLIRQSRQNRTWAGVAGMLMVVRILKRASSRRPEVVATDRLAAGQSMTITAIARPTRRQRRAARRTASTD